MPRSLRWAGALCAGGCAVLLAACGPTAPTTASAPLSRTTASVLTTSNPTPTTTVATTVPTTTTPPRRTTTTHRAIVHHTVTPRPTHTTTRKPTPRTKCTASMTDSTPADNHATDVIVHTAAGARVTATAHYKTTTTSHSATANGSGTAEIEFLISRATPGFTVIVSVAATAHGSSGSCSTSFTPVK